MSRRADMLIASKRDILHPARFPARLLDSFRRHLEAIAPMFQSS